MMTMISESSTIYLVSCSHRASCAIQYGVTHHHHFDIQKDSEGEWWIIKSKKPLNVYQNFTPPTHHHHHIDWSYFYHVSGILPDFTISSLVSLPRLLSSINPHTLASKI